MLYGDSWLRLDINELWRHAEAHADDYLPATMAVIDNRHGSEPSNATIDGPLVRYRKPQDEVGAVRRRHHIDYGISVSSSSLLDVDGPAQGDLAHMMETVGGGSRPPTRRPGPTTRWARSRGSPAWRRRYGTWAPWADTIHPHGAPTHGTSHPRWSPRPQHDPAPTMSTDARLDQPGAVQAHPTDPVEVGSPSTTCPTEVSIVIPALDEAITMEARSRAPPGLGRRRRAR